MFIDSRARQLVKRLEKKTRRGHRGDPIGTVAFYGPTNRLATKVVVGISIGGKVGELQKRFSESGDVRDSEIIMQAVIEHLERSGAVSIAMTPGIYGCPHEESTDYPEGSSCPSCPFWAEIDRESIFES